MYSVYKMDQSTAYGGMRSRVFIYKLIMAVSSTK